MNDQPVIYPIVAGCSFIALGALGAWLASSHYENVKKYAPDCFTNWRIFWLTWPVSRLGFIMNSLTLLHMGVVALVEADESLQKALQPGLFYSFFSMIFLMCITGIFDAVRHRRQVLGRSEYLKCNENQ